jgi:Pvc16 N-terminal domain
MIMSALQFTNDVLDQYLKNKFSLDDRKVILNNIIDSNGSIPLANQNKVVLSLINIEKETSKPFYQRNQKLVNGNFADVNPAERYNLDVLITSNFDDYAETLKFLNAAIQFFQTNVSLDSSGFSNIPKGINKLEFDIEKISYHQMHSLWTAMGAKYQPSVIYKMRLVTIQGNESAGFVKAIDHTANTANG